MPWDNKSLLQKESGQKVLSFSWNLALRGRRNDTHYEIIGVDILLVVILEGSVILKGSVWSKKSFPFFAENMIIRSILNLWWHSEILKSEINPRRR